MNPRIKQNLLHIGLFLVTFITTTLAGAEWTYGKFAYGGDFTWADFASGLRYSISFLLILTAHEFGHYFTAIYYRVKTTLPYYIPFYIPFLPFTIGTMGALIRIKQKVNSTKQNFDIGIAGPLAGFVVAIGILWYGFTHLPPPDYVFQFHPEYQQYGLEYANFVYKPELMGPNVVDVVVGKNLIFYFFEHWIADPSRVPNPHEIMHYPFLFAGFLSLVFTSINLLPIGQLDGGHVLYGLVGHRYHRWIASGVFILFLFYTGLGYAHPSEPLEDLLMKIPIALLFGFFSLKGLGLPARETIMITLGIFVVQYLTVTLFPTAKGYSGWIVFAYVIGRFIGVQHPPSDDETPLSLGRKILGWVALIIFVLCFAPNPL